MFKEILVFSFMIILVATQHQLQNIAVIENDALEQTYPNEFRNPFYRTPRIREVLARSSWFGPGEEPVLDRQSEKIPRSEIYSVLTHAGFIPRQINFN